MQRPGLRYPRGEANIATRSSDLKKKKIQGSEILYSDNELRNARTREKERTRFREAVTPRRILIVQVTQHRPRIYFRLGLGAQRRIRALDFIHGRENEFPARANFESGGTELKWWIHGNANGEEIGIATLWNAP